MPTTKGTFDTAAFYAALDSQRASKKKNWKQVAEESGVSASTLTRMANGKRPDIDGLAALLKWSGLQAEDFIESNEPGDPETLAKITALFRKDKNLSTESANAIVDIVQAAYECFREK